MDNGSRDSPELGYNVHFEGSKFDVFMNGVLLCNSFWIVYQSVYTLNDWESKPWFQTVDLFFCLIYLVEVGLKLCYWSFAEYWFFSENRFDFVTTIILATAAIVFITPEKTLEHLTGKLGMHHMHHLKSKSLLRYLNMLRLVRLLKALTNIPAFQRICWLVQQMVQTCTHVLAINILIIYIWAAAGVMLFGGRLHASNPNLTGLTYFTSNYQAFNFNDVASGMVTMFYCMLAGWQAALTEVGLAVGDKYTARWWISHCFFFSFYVAGPLLSWNIFAAFSIDVYCNLDDMLGDNDQVEEDEVDQNLDRIMEDFAAKGMVLHITKSPAVMKAKLLRAMYGTPDSENVDSLNPAEEPTSSADQSKLVLKLQHQLTEANKARAHAEQGYAKAMSQLAAHKDYMSTTLNRLQARPGAGV
jgi:hypothetical protein